jgi:hypothetical protein
MCEQEYFRIGSDVKQQRLLAVRCEQLLRRRHLIWRDMTAVVGHTHTQNS